MKKFFALTALIISLLTSTALANNTILATYFVVNCNESITLREYPSVYARELAQIPLGQAVGYIEEVDENFTKVNYDGLIGYVLSSYISLYSPFRDATVVNCRQSITLRETATTAGNELAQIPLGARVKYLGVQTDSFYKVEYKGLVGYVLKTYIEFD